MPKASTRETDIMKNIITTTEQLKKCNQTMCKEQTKKAEKMKQQVTKELKFLQAKYEAKQLDSKSYTEKLKELVKIIRTSESTIKLMECSVDQCNKYIKALVEVIQKAHAHDCTIEKKKSACKKADTLGKILKNDRITFKQYQSFILS